MRINGFAADTEIEALSSALLETRQRYNSVPQVTRLGVSQYQHGIQGSKTGYFRLAQAANETQRVVFTSSFDPVTRLKDRFLTLGLDAAVMIEPGFGSYFAGSGKLRNGASPIHVDFAPQDSAGWAIAQCVSQLAWNLYLQVPTGHGELLLWDKLWQRDDDAFQVNDNYFYRPQVVNGADSLSIEAKQGDLVIINSRNFHAVAEAENRLAIGSFISVFADYSLRFWS